MNNAIPYYTLLAIILMIIFLWFLFGGGNYKFIGIGPLYPDNVITRNYEEITAPSTVKDTSIEDFICLTEKEEKEEKLDILHDVPVIYNKEEEIDLTPTLPDDFKDKVCDNNNNKFVSKGEQVCRDTMERIYGVPFINTRPNWLKNPATNRNLELDCYNDKLKLAVEYNGIQHYKWCSFAKQTYTDFREQVKRDRIKIDLCEKNGVYLIVVPYNVSISLIPTYIMYHLPEIVRKRLMVDDPIL